MRQAAFRIGAVALPLLVLLVLPELVARTLDLEVQRYTAIQFGGDETSSELFMRDPALHWKLRPGVDLAFKGVRVRTNDWGFRGPPLVEGRKRMLVLGDSTPFGWGVEEEESFPGQLERRLAPKGWQVLNAGVPGYTSWQTRVAAERLLPRLRPQLVVVCVGNNEGWRGRVSDRQAHEARWLRRPFERVLTSSRAFTWLAEQVLPDAPATAHPAQVLGVEPRVALRDFGANLTAIAAAADAVGARVVFIGPPVSVYVPPWNLGHRDGWEEWGDWFPKMGRAIDAGEIEAALREIESRREAAPESFFPQWLHGYALAVLGDLERGRLELEAALDRYPAPERAPRAYRKAVRQVAWREGVPYLDPNRLFHARARGRIPREFYYDQAHPSVAGHRLIAVWLAEVVPQVSVPTRPPSQLD